MHYVFIVRHGTTTGIEAELIQGSTDSPLCEKGKQEARKTAAAMADVHFRSVFCSPTGRTRETAKIILQTHHPEPIYLENLREMDFGWLEGRRYFNAPDHEEPLFKRIYFLARILYAQLTGERISQVSWRAEKSWAVIRAAAPSGKVLVISHGVLLNYFLRFLLPKEDCKAIQPVRLNHCGITELKVWEPGNAEIVRLNDISHLKD